MKIAYIGQMADVSKECSIAKKIRDQTKAWQSAGHQVCYFALAPGTQVWDELARTLPTQLIVRGPLWKRAGNSQALCRSIQAWGPDVIYFRYAHHSPGLPELFERIPAVAEINSDDTREYALTLGFWKTLYHSTTREKILRKAAGFIPVTHELADLTARYARPYEVIANSIPLDDFQTLPISVLKPRPTRLVFIGSPKTPWHGLERIAELARLFPEWGFDIIGDDHTGWSESVPGPLPANVALHGRLNSEKYLPIMEAATAALGTFGLYRKGMQEACPLKVREYLARGLPVIGACADTDIPDNAEYYLRLPNDAASLESHRTSITAFMERWRDRRVTREAIAHIDTSVKEAARLGFMTNITATGTTHA